MYYPNHDELTSLGFKFVESNSYGKYYYIDDWIEYIFEENKFLIYDQIVKFKSYENLSNYILDSDMKATEKFISENL